MFISEDISFHIISLGCAKNLVDSERINGAMTAAGFVTAESSSEADIVIINTCGFILEAKEESIEVILDAIDDQRSDNDRMGGAEGQRLTGKIVAVGCLLQRYFEDIQRDIPELDFIYGIPDSRFVGEMCKALNIRIRENTDSLRRPLEQGLAYSYIKLSEGCSNNCSYCAIPLIRGAHNSYDPDIIVADARNAVKTGARELVMVAQDITAYRWGTTGLPDLVRLLARESGAQWIRLMYCHPDHLDDSIIGIFGNTPEVVRYIDIPFQHASRRILRSMGRKGSGPGYLEMLSWIRNEVPGIRIRSTFMVGYPGEDDSEFDELLSFIEAAQIDRAGAFIYSPEEGTPAFGMGDPVSNRIKRKRYRALMKLQQKISSERLSEMVGSVIPVLVEERIDENVYIGRTEFDAPEVDGIFYLTADLADINSIVNARVTDSTEHDLIGVIS